MRKPILTAALALAVPSILWPPRPVRAEELPVPSVAEATLASTTLSADLIR